eukprot:TRINITY_DN11889_c0_g2_i1.p1 TRINITY_DN11889_c0_g2~~TRINITY_DN11889_c0_g2_i1.p1  ORF type:complete len:188 (+),score=27.11 TRINITY_DN11889_c0_g2_i1:59-565(+)
MGELQKSVTLVTSMGEIELEFYPDYAPKTVENFLTLVGKKYYDDTVSHRIISDFMVQMGDPTGTGRGGKSCWGHAFEDECTRNLKHTGAGILSMANSGPDTNGSQFFLTLGPAEWLDGKHTIFGRVSKGMRVLKRLGRVPVDKNDRPLEEVKIIKATTGTSVRQPRPY